MYLYDPPIVQPDEISDSVGGPFGFPLSTGHTWLDLCDEADRDGKVCGYDHVVNEWTRACCRPKNLSMLKSTQFYKSSDWRFPTSLLVIEYLFHLPFYFRPESIHICFLSTDETGRKNGCCHAGFGVSLDRRWWREGGQMTNSGTAHTFAFGRLLGY